MKFLALAVVVALASAGCTQKGWSYCSNSKKCGAGLGDCDSNSHCKSGLTCVSSDPKNPQLWKWPVDCCQCPSGIGNGGWHSCSANCQCSENGGDCDSNSQCKSPLVCRSSGLGQSLGGSAKDYCCKKSGDWSACNTGNCKCQNGEGDCDSDSQCLSGLKCLSGQAGQKITGSAKDVCTKIVNKGWSGCTNSKKCGHGEGDCDRNSHCKSGHVCISTSNGQPLPGSAVDVCVKKVLVSAEDNAAEADAEDMDEAEATTTEDEDLSVEPTEDAEGEAAVETEATEGEADVLEQEDELVDEE